MAHVQQTFVELSTDLPRTLGWLLFSRDEETSWNPVPPFQSQGTQISEGPYSDILETQMIKWVPQSALTSHSSLQAGDTDAC